MIRLIQRKLIIPRGDTGSFTVPAIAAGSGADVAVFTIFDCLTHSKLYEKIVQVSGGTIAIEFTHNDTVNLAPGKYAWDIKFYKNPVFADGELVNGEEIDSYYAGYSLPECEIRETGDNLQISPAAPQGTLTPAQLDIISAALAALATAVAQTETNVTHYPQIRDEEWYIWDATIGDYVATGVAANGIIGPTGNGIASSVLNNDYTLTITYTDGTTYTTPSIRGATPSVVVTDIERGHRLTVTDDTGAHSFDVMNGRAIQDILLNNDYTLTINYDDGTFDTTGSIRGAQGPTGNGISGIAKTGTSGLVDTYTVTYTNGSTSTFTVTNGDSGVYVGSGTPPANANVWIDPSGTNAAAITAQVHSITGGAQITVTDGSGTTTANVYDGPTGHGVPTGGTSGQVLKKASATDYDTEWATETHPVTDVQVAGTSVVSGGVANVPIASASTPGVVKIQSGYGLTMFEGTACISQADSSQIKNGSNYLKAIAPNRQHESTFYGLAKAAGDTTQSASSNAVGTYTETAKSKISTMLNAPVTVSGSTPTITALSGIQYICGEVATLDITLPASGCVDVVFESGSTATVLTITPPTGYTVEWANDFDSTALEADTMYEINIRMIGTKCLGVAGSWT